MFSLSYEPFSYFFWAVPTTMKGPGKVFKVGGNSIEKQDKKSKRGMKSTFHADSTQKVRRARKNFFSR